MYKYDKYEWSDWNEQSRHPFLQTGHVANSHVFFCMSIVCWEKQLFLLDSTPKLLRQFDTFSVRQTPDSVQCISSSFASKVTKHRNLKTKTALDPLCFDVFCLSLSELQSYYFNCPEYVVVSNSEIFQEPVVMMVLQHFRNLNKLLTNSQTKGHVPPFQVEHPLLVFSQWKAQRLLLLLKGLWRVLSATWPVGRGISLCIFVTWWWGSIWLIVTIPFLAFSCH